MTKQLVQGNEACVEAALRAGVGFFAGYPITPSTEIAEKMAEKLPAAGKVFIQMEDEIASMAAIIGASIAGTKAMTATSGPGFSLMQENIGYAAMAEIPVVVVNVQRGGPSTGSPTRASQGDFMQARWGTHGDHPIIALAPSSVQEIYDFTVEAFNLAERYMVPVVLLLDEIVGHMREGIELSAPERVIDRKLAAIDPANYKPYRCGENSVPVLAPFGQGYRYHITGLVHDSTGFPSNDPKTVDNLLRRLNNKIEKNREDIIRCNTFDTDDAEVIIVAYGSPVRSARQVVKNARAAGLAVGLVQLITVWPFPHTLMKQLARDTGATFVVPELNLGQMAAELAQSVPEDRIISVNRIDGSLVTPEELEKVVKEAIK